MESNDWQLVEVIATVIEMAGVLVIGVGVLIAGFVALRDKRADPSTVVYIAFRHGMARWLLLGLELLIAADIIATVTLNLVLESVLALGVLVLIRTFLAWSITMENEGHWPWQRPQGDQSESVETAPNQVRNRS